jgi:hypothetical protein
MSDSLRYRETGLAHLVAAAVDSLADYSLYNINGQRNFVFDDSTAYIIYKTPRTPRHWWQIVKRRPSFIVCEVTMQQQEKRTDPAGKVFFPIRGKEHLPVLAGIARGLVDRYPIEADVKLSGRPPLKWSFLKTPYETVFHRGS